MGLRSGSDPANYETDFVLIGLLYQLCYIHPILESIFPMISLCEVVVSVI